MPYTVEASKAKPAEHARSLSPRRLTYYRNRRSYRFIGLPNDSRAIQYYLFTSSVRSQGTAIDQKFEHGQGSKPEVRKFAANQLRYAGLTAFTPQPQQ